MRLNHKRLALLSGKAARACARVVGLTPARVDLMAILLVAEKSQMQLAAILCVTAPVVSRMLEALEDLGLVRRRVPSWDRRRKLVSLTAAGRQRLVICLDDHDRREPDGIHSAQCIGENTWLHDWLRPLTRLGLELESYFELERVSEALFTAMQAWNLMNDYAGAFNGWGDTPEPVE